MYFRSGYFHPLIMARTATRIARTALREVSADNLRKETLVRELERGERASRRRRRLVLMAVVVTLIGLLIRYVLL